MAFHKVISIGQLKVSLLDPFVNINHMNTMVVKPQVWIAFVVKRW